ncbi:MAG: hypothetical protein BWY57_00943 [Betaproteobacteria bacterium ADurb.Bin341]|nr:MAG: hypothetical protein BWY57_00943 [Betaproteobacteria bacterium ADurb.Bin341]
MDSTDGIEFSPRTVALVGKFRSPEISGPLVCLAECLNERGITVLVETAKPWSVPYCPLLRFDFDALARN